VIGGLFSVMLWMKRIPNSNLFVDYVYLGVSLVSLLRLFVIGLIVLFLSVRQAPRTDTITGPQVTVNPGSMDIPPTKHILHHINSSLPLVGFTDLVTSGLPTTFRTCYTPHSISGFARLSVPLTVVDKFDALQ